MTLWAFNFTRKRITWMSEIESSTLFFCKCTCNHPLVWYCILKWDQCALINSKNENVSRKADWCILCFIVNCSTIETVASWKTFHNLKVLSNISTYKEYLDIYLTLIYLLIYLTPDTYVIKSYMKKLFF